MRDFNVHLLNTGNKSEVSEFYDALSSHFVASYTLQLSRIVRNYKTLMDNILLDSIKVNSYTGNLTSKMSDHHLKISGLSAFWETLKT